MLPRRKKPRYGTRDDTGPIRSPGHLSFVRGFVCVAHESMLCEGRIEAAHYRTAANSGVGVKPGDEWTFPACELHHRMQHALGQDAFEKRYGLDLAATCRRLANASAHIRKIKQERGA